MDCPQCRGYKLEPHEIEPGLLAAVCSKCEGALLSLMNYRFWNDRNQPVLDADEECEVIEDSNNAKTCPKCSRFMSKFNIGSGESNRLDLCTGCDEAWLDKGEWRLLKMLDLHNQLPKIFTDAWQRNLRIERQEQHFKKRFEKLFGKDDFDRVDQFKRWMSTHAEMENIKLYLTTKIE